MNDGETIRIINWDVPYYEEMTFGEIKALEGIIGEEAAAREKGESVSSTEQWLRVLLVLVRSRLGERVSLKALEDTRVDAFSIERDVGLLISPFLRALARKLGAQSPLGVEVGSTESPEPSSSSS